MTGRDKPPCLLFLWYNFIKIDRVRKEFTMFNKFKKQDITDRNLYDELDRRGDYANEQDEKRRAFRRRKENTLSAMSDVFRFIILIGVIALAFILKSVYWEDIKAVYYNVEDKVASTIDNSDSNRGTIETTTHNREKQKVQSEMPTQVPNIVVSGNIQKEGVEYMIFKMDNKIYTQKVGDKFDNDLYQVTKVTDKTLEIKDLDGNVFSYSK